MPEQHFDVLIAGAGPAGSSAAIKLANSGLSVALLDKASFPRDKTCGDALSVDVINQLPMLSEQLSIQFAQLADKIPSYGVRIFSPSYHHIDIPFIHRSKKDCGFVSPRLSFDYLLFQHACSHSNIHAFQDCTVSRVEVTNERVYVQSNQGLFTGQMIIGADGAHSAVAKSLSHFSVERKHYSAGLRVYYQNVTSFHQENFIELHFFRNVLPGYLWIFPLAGNKSNVGIGMPSSEVAKKKVNLKESLISLLQTHPQLKERFKDAKPLESIKGFGLPLGSKRRNISGERFLLAGDAASLIDPFTGEGIANAIRSGRVAAEQVVQCFRIQNFSAAFNKAYDKEIYRRMGREFKVSRMLQRLARYPALIDFVVRKAGNSQYLQTYLTEALADVEKKKMLWKPGFYYRILFNR